MSRAVRAPRRLEREQLRKVVVIGSRWKPAGQDVARAIVGWLSHNGVEVVEDIDGELDLEQAVQGADLAISVGGDGTMLSTARRMGPAQVPTMGVNLGRLGFLAEFSEVEVRDWIAGRLELPLAVEPRMRLRCALQDGKAPGQVQYALNDAVISQGVLTRLVTVEMLVDGALATSYRADGVIVSTPVGSTAYSLSLGGPILTPGLKAFIVTPIAPHALTNRPIVVSGQSRLAFRIVSPVGEAALVLDGHEQLPLREGDTFEVRRASKDFLVVASERRSYYDLLRTRLGWGELPRLRPDGEA